MKIMETLKWLCVWYSTYCDGDWEHDKRISIATMDNPGWRVDINIENTELEGKLFEELVIEKSEDDWIHCSVKDNFFKGRGGTENLEDILKNFRDWVTEK